jgi:hypothetical protein
VKSSKSAEKREQSLQNARLCERPQLTVEVTEKMTRLEIDLWRLAHSKAATESEAAEAAAMIFKSLRQRDSRYAVRQLGSESLKLSLMRESGSSHNYNAGI